MNPPLRIALAGLGTVGSGVCALLAEHAALLEERGGRKLDLALLSSRTRARAAGCHAAHIPWEDDPLALAARDDIEVVIELIGGAEGMALALVEAALRSGKHVVTANKALIARHGVRLARIAEEKGVQLAYEAAVAGGIPLIKTLREGLAANRFGRILGILNGTCNFILSLMAREKAEFDAALRKAQEAGFAEADPSFDIDGVDTAHKLSIIASLAYGCPPRPDLVHIEGIRAVTRRDMEFAHELGFAVKLLGIASCENGVLLQRVHPCLIPIHSALGALSGGDNAVIIEGDAVGRITLEGPGAGARPTASSVVGDLIDIARGAVWKPFVLPTGRLQDLPAGSMDDLEISCYIRLAVKDQPGVLAAVTGALSVQGISLRTFFQRAEEDGKSVQLVLTTHQASERALRAGLEALLRFDFVTEPPHMIRIEPL